MHCAGCVDRVERALAAIPGVTKASVNLATERADLVFAGDAGVLVDAVRAVGYDAELSGNGPSAVLPILRDRDERLRRQRGSLVAAVVLGLPILALDLAAHAVWAGVVQGALSLLLIASSAGRPILVRGLRGAMRAAPDMDTLIALGVIAAVFGGWVGLLRGDHALHHIHAAAMILGFINLGKYWEIRAMRDAGAAIAGLARRLPQEALRRRDGHVESVPPDLVEWGDVVIVPSDTLVPVDGVVVSGAGTVDESAITGESMPQEKCSGNAVLAGSLLREGALEVRTTAVGADAALGRILRAVEAAQAGKAPMQRLADRVAGVFVPVVMVLALVTLAGWWLTGDASRAFGAFIATLVIACPCAMGLATPTAVLVASGEAARQGILVRDVAALEAAAGVTGVLFDKTGTLTTGRPQVAEVVVPGGSSPGWDRDRVLSIAAAAEQFSQHPLARAIVEEARLSGRPLPEAREFVRAGGLGVSAIVAGERVRVGSEAHLAAGGANVSSFAGRFRSKAAEGFTVVGVSADSVCVGAIALLDTPRPGAPETIQRLRELGLTSAMLTGDQPATARAIAERVGIHDVHAAMLPEHKLDEVMRRRRAGERVAFVGDGINDAPALEAADIGIAFAGGTDVAAASAGLVLVREDLNLVPAAILLARRCVRIMKQNLCWAAGYNVVAIPLAMSGHVPSSLAGAAMMLSSLSVILNSLRLRRAWKHGNPPEHARRSR